ncbi:hypothetical protein F4810DRAFT_722429 [Camillea tinctor]|nr:hypothetical protein F4810DRAFT_722429 [Camillea tinctor]
MAFDEDNTPTSSAAAESRSPKETHNSDGQEDSVTELNEASSASTMADESTGQTTVSSRLSLRESLGIQGTLIIIGGGIINAGAWGFLVFLWFGDGHTFNGAQAPHFWRYLMINGWISQTITLLSLVLRLVVSAQATVCTSLLASLVLENHHVPLSEVVRYTILRGVNDGPFGLLKLTFSGLRLWRKTFRRIESLLVTLLFLAALAINFSSTILLSDIGFSEVVHDQTTKDVGLAFNISTSVFVQSAKFWTERPRAYATFGETNSGLVAAPNNLGVSDTGVVRRVFFPFANASERTTISRYSGAAWVMDSRTTCMPPEIQGLISGDSTHGRRVSSFGIGRFTGNISYDTTLQRAGLSKIPLCNNQRCLPTQFDCALPGASEYIQVREQWMHSFCVLVLAGNYTSAGNVELPTWDINDSPMSTNSSIHLVLSTNSPSSFWRNIGNETFSTMNAGKHDEWNSYRIGQGLHVNASICFSSLDVSMSQVTLQAHGKIDEPTLKFDKNTKQWDTSTVRSQLGTNKSVQDFARRGIFKVETIGDISPEGSQDKSQPFNSTVAGIATVFLQRALTYDLFLFVDETDYAVALCDYCYKYGIGVDREIISLLGDVLRFTQRAATAILTSWSVLGQTYFYDLLDLLDVSGEALTVSTANVQIPLHSRGFIAVSIILAVHLASITVITIFYIAKTRYSRQGNLWYAISQIVCHETESILTECNEMKDDGVTDLMKNDDHLVGLARSENNGRVELVRRIVNS